MTTPALDLAIDIGPLYGHRTGVGVAADGLVTALRERDDVRLAPYLVSFRSDPDTGHRKLPVPGIVASHLWSRFDHPRADRWLGPVDVVHGTNYVAPPSDRPTVISVYDCWFLANPDHASPLVRRAGRTLRRRVADGAWIHTSSAATAEQARSLLDTDRVVSVHLGPPPQSGVLPASTPAGLEPLQGAPFVLAIGTEERRKDLPTLVAAFGELASERPTVRLALAGARGDQSGEVDLAVETLAPDAGARVHRLGPIDASTKAWLLRHASVLAYPSLDEGFGFPILEAQAAGTPVVATDVGSVGEVAGEGAVLVTGRSVTAFARQLAAVVDGTASRLSLISAGHENLTRFSWAATADGLMSLYRRALEER
jgi:glycosyltransferase involved in cell wall biosynthesis